MKQINTDENLLFPKIFFNLLYRESPQCYVFLVELSNQTAYLIDFHKDPIRYNIIREFEIASGKQKGGKRSEWDLRTPIGFYEITQYRPPHTLEKKFGPGAYVLNYPNYMDRMEKKTGSGIWVHGTDRVNFIDFDSEGCIRVKNDELPFLRDYLQPRNSPVIIVETIEWMSLEQLTNEKDEFQKCFNSWLESWQSNALDRYLEYYHSSFLTTTPNNMDRARWVLYKRDISLNNPPISISMNDVSIIYRNNLILLRAEQHYRSQTFADIGIKTLLWEKTEQGWFIIKEEWQPK